VSLSAGRPKIDPRLVHMGTEVDKEAVGMGFLQILPSYPPSVTPQMSHTNSLIDTKTTAPLNNTNINAAHTKTL
jgi:hypothetical protein